MCAVHLPAPDMSVSLKSVNSLCPVTTMNPHFRRKNKQSFRAATLGERLSGSGKARRKINQERQKNQKQKNQKHVLRWKPHWKRKIIALVRQRGIRGLRPQTRKAPLTGDSGQ